MSSLAYHSMERQKQKLRSQVRTAPINFSAKADVFRLLAADQIRKARAALKRAMKEINDGPNAGI